MTDFGACVPMTSSTTLSQMTSIFGFLNRRSCRIFSARRKSRRWISVTLLGEVRQEQRFLDGGVAAADDDDLFALDRRSRRRSRTRKRRGL